VPVFCQSVLIAVSTFDFDIARTTSANYKALVTFFQPGHRLYRDSRRKMPGAINTPC
jgi:hypothetical protein